MNKNIENIYTKYFITSTTDLNGIITHISDAFCKVSGYSKEELIGNTHGLIKHADTPREVFDDLWNTIKSQKKWTGILKNRTKDGQAYWVDCAIEPIFDNNFKMIGFQSVRFNITSQYDLKSAKENIEKSLKTFKKLFENVNSGIAILSKEGQLIDVNPYILNLFGYSKEEYLKMSYFDLSKRIQNVKVKDLIEDILNNTISQKTLQKEFKTKDGRNIWIEITYSAFDNNSILLSINNIENQKKLEQTTGLLIQQSRNAAMGEMLSMIAHQWRQPLATLSTITSKIKIKYELDMYSKEAFDIDYEKISSVIKHLSQTIEYFRNYFKPKISSKENFIQINNSLKNIIEPLCEKYNIKLLVDNENDEKILIDSRIDQVLLNIYKNSMEACFEKNKEGLIKTKIYLLDDFVNIEISDNGGGIDENNIDKIFEPYYSTKNKNGTGLGLYMCKNIIENHLEGFLTVENIQNGVSFKIKLKKEME